MCSLICIYIYHIIYTYICMREQQTLAVSFRGLRGHRGQRGHRGHVPRDCPVTPCVLYICPRGAWHLRSERCSGFTKDQWRYDGDMYIIMYISYIMLYHVLLYHVISSYIIISCCIMLYQYLCYVCGFLVICWCQLEDYHDVSVTLYRPEPLQLHV